MSFTRYSKYKDSGVDWLGEVPEHWGIRSLKHSVTEIYSGGTPESGNEEYWADDDDATSIPWVAIADMTRDSTVQMTERSISPAGLASKRLEVLPTGTLLYSMYASLGKVAVLGLPAAINQAILGIVPDPKTCRQEFLRYWLIQMENHLPLFSSSNTQDNLNAGKVRSLPLLVPLPTEQALIAAFLDRETAKIDGLVGEQRRLIELLKEKRQAVISHAVTKGLNPHAPMKPSGIEWLGDVPENWRVTRLGYFATVENGTTPSRENLAYWIGGEVPWLSSGEVNQSRITEANEFITEQALGECSLRLLPKGTVVIGMIGQGKTRGMSALLEIEATINQNLAAVVPGSDLNAEYLNYIFQSAYVYLREYGRGGQQAALNCEILRAVRIPIPPIHEQAGICDHLQHLSTAYDTLTAEAQRAIDLLQERRTALISAAVTGKIDVRGLSETEAA